MPSTRKLAMLEICRSVWGGYYTKTTQRSVQGIGTAAYQLLVETKGISFRTLYTKYRSKELYREL